MENSVRRTTPQINIVLTIISLVSLIILGFYSMYGNIFIFNRVESYIFPVLSLIHFLYLYVLWFKITENEYPDMIMKNIEYIMYGILLAYGYNIYETFLILGSQSEFQGHVIPSSFVPMGFLIIALQSLLVVLTVWSFVIRIQRVGKYDFDYLNNHIDAWE
ncbi:hypothetical protein QSE00_08540 [Arenibacter sp. M-2]|uniref:hypothetical protein n=1 Tax=unclassified Arenibacter TaxID=2615047 RepID=UPI000D764722|nr:MULTISPECIES: hypothetical protein [unclassified Arenibacter]MDL5511857.1 hypothetical protein [Arenibacter sp. M-2]PXX29777.1 hypothetical protein C7972_103146 [Arenibacter sp. ARW7G5Y1]|tara:strand:+ start:3900 stop:4382 length:483 start_codon:yes stop_codon:yes gene_type:complete